MEDEYTFKIVTVGDAHTGKSCMTVRFNEINLIIISHQQWVLIS